jgi:hypothetical protein
MAHDLWMGCPVLLAALLWLWCGPLFYGKPTGREADSGRRHIDRDSILRVFPLGCEHGLKYQGFQFALMTGLGSVALPRWTDSFDWSVAADFLISCVESNARIPTSWGTCCNRGSLPKSAPIVTHEPAHPIYVFW